MKSWKLFLAGKPQNVLQKKQTFYLLELCLLLDYVVVNPEKKNWSVFSENQKHDSFERIKFSSQKASFAFFFEIAKQQMR